MSKISIPISKPYLSLEEKKNLIDAFDSTWISSKGKYIDEFETRFAKLCRVKQCISVANGTVALHLALLALGIGPGDEVIVPSLTYVATANAIKYVGATPIFIDVDKNNWCLDHTQIEKLVSSKTKAIIYVNLYGHPADADAINRIAKKYNIKVIEDAAESHMALYKNRPTGGLSDIGVFSFYGNKILTSGEGGALTLNSSRLAKRIRLLRGQGMHPKRQYYFPIIGYNYRLTNIASAILVAQINRREKILDKRRKVYSLYNKYLSNINGIILQTEESWAKISPWLYSILIVKKDYGMSRDDLSKIMHKYGIETRPFFPPIHMLPSYKEDFKKQKLSSLKVTTELSKSGINLPTYPELNEEEIKKICQIIVNRK